MTIFGCPLNEQGQLIGSVFGSALLALSVMHYMQRKSIASVGIPAFFLYFNFLFNAIDFPIMLNATLAGVMNNLGWMPVCVNAFIASTSLYLILKR
jgi:hypothetical protein